eukprot:comp22737_c0_seq1/m.35426 comp22737_c0_seq1/g.35426  ORF comp22737_c0_seq1/g.35426 comp22737_c0_seq1/m.35426 type:complete len:695 (-) comp22737_c0_seq1:363-2447(-)
MFTMFSLKSKRKPSSFGKQRVLIAGVFSCFVLFLCMWAAGKTTNLSVKFVTEFHASQNENEATGGQDGGKKALHAFSQLDESTSPDNLKNIDIVSSENEFSSENLPTGVKSCVLAVASSVRLLETISLAALQTWVPDVEKVCDVFFFVGRGDVPPSSVAAFGDRLVQLEVEDDYPPLRKVFGLWDRLYRHPGQYQWFAKIDADTYVNARQLHTLISNRLPNMANPPHYFGTIGWGLPEERPLLGIKQPYCLGMGYFISRSAVEKIGERFVSDCVDNVKSNHSDTEMGRCVHRHMRVGCRYSPVPVTNMYWHIPDGSIHGMEWNENKQLAMDFPTAPPTSTFESVFVHPFKSIESLTLFHRQSKFNMRPPFASAKCDVSMQKRECRSAQSQIKGSCVNSPSAQLQITNGSVFLPECAPVDPTREPNLDVPVFVLSLDSDEGLAGYAAARNLLVKAGLTSINRFIGTNGKLVFADAKGTLKPGELGYRDTMKRLFEYAKNESLERIIIVDDDAKPRKNFVQAYKMLMGDKRCSGHMWTENEGGIVMFGGTVWVNGTYPRFGAWYGGWKMIDQDRKNNSQVMTVQRKNRNGKPGKFEKLNVLSMCYNANRFSVGSFAGMYHRSVYQSIISWLESDNAKPFDHIFSYLSEIGHIVRVAYPNLFIPDVGHKSTVDPGRTSMGLKERAPIHRWEVSVYDW